MIPTSPARYESCSSVGRWIERCAVVSLLATTGLLPWWLGGVIPAARLMLQVGSALTMSLVLVAALMQKRQLALPSVGFWLLISFAGIGILQLLPLFPPAATEMQHAVLFPGSLPGVGEQKSTSRVEQEIGGHPRSTAPAWTRFHVAQWLALGLLFCSAGDLLRSRQRMMVCFASMTANACFLTVIAILQMFGDGEMWIGGDWRRYAAMPFGTFVNPNNAAGWLGIHLAVSIGLLFLVWERPSPGRTAGRVHQRTLADRFFAGWDRILERVASLNAVHFLVLFAVVLILSGIAATLSRAGICSGIACVLMAGLHQFRGRKLLAYVVPLALLLGLAMGFLTLFDLDTRVFSELKTLKDPASESTGRLLHWSDSLAAVKDFPVIGAGQGTYRFCSLPYQRRWVGKWFVNADNQYVEILVESGCFGLLLFIGFGVLGIRDSWKLLRSSSPGRDRPTPGSGMPVLGAIGLAMIVSQSMAMMFDFGIGASANSAAFVMILGLISAAATASPGMFPAELPLSSTPVISWSIRLCCLWGVVSFVPDLVAANEIYPVMVKSERTLRKPITRDQLSRLPELQRTLEVLLQKRPDDLDGRLALMTTHEARYRLAVADALSETALDDERLQQIWDQISPFGLADRMGVLRSSATVETQLAIESVLEKMASEQNWIGDARLLQKLAPLMPGTQAELMAATFALSGDLPADEALAMFLFSEPANASRLFLVGHLCLLADDRMAAIRCWKQANSVSEAFRNPILAEAWNKWPQDEVLRDLAPLKYEETVKAAEQAGIKDLQEALWSRAAEQWQVIRVAPLTAQQCLQRARQLRACVPADALPWIDQCLLERPENLELRRMRADLLERSGRLQEAIGELLRIQHYAPEDAAAENGIRRLSEQL